MIQLAVSCGYLYLIRYCALKWTGILTSTGKQGYVFILTDFKSDVLMFHSCVVLCCVRSHNLVGRAMVNLIFDTMDLHYGMKLMRDLRF